MASWKNVPFAQEAKFCKTVAQAILAGVKFQIYRTKDGKVQTFELHHVGLDWGNGKLYVHYQESEYGNIITEPATEQDLKLISQQARQLEATHKSKGR